MVKEAINYFIVGWSDLMCEMLLTYFKEWIKKKNKKTSYSFKDITQKMEQISVFL